MLSATVAYDGTDFLGFQLQSNGRTVQGVLESALAQATQASVRVIGSGRQQRSSCPGARSSAFARSGVTRWRISIGP